MTSRIASQSGGSNKNIDTSTRSMLSFSQTPYSQKPESFSPSTASKGYSIKVTKPLSEKKKVADYDVSLLLNS